MDRNGDHLRRLKDAADPARIVAALGLRGRGRRFFCPACQPDGGKSPDLSVTDKGFCCFKCGRKGDLLALVMLAKGLDFPSAVRWLEGETGTAPSSPGRPMDRPRKVDPGPSCEAGGAVSGIYRAFLDACRPVEGPVLDWLRDRGVADYVVAALGLRFCGREYQDIMAALGAQFGDDALASAGLLKKNKGGRLVPSYWHYFASKAGVLVIPYFRAGLPVYLKVRPPISKSAAGRRNLVRFMNTAAAVPCLYNCDALADHPDRVLICEGESDTWTALSAGVPAVGSPGARGFKAEWVEDFRGIEDHAGRSRVFLVLDADKAGAEGARTIAGLFVRAGLPVPLLAKVPPGQDLTDFMKGGITS